MIVIFESSEGPESSVLHDLFLEAGYPSAVMKNVDPRFRIDCAVGWLGSPDPEVFSDIDPERVVIADPAAVVSLEPGVAFAEAARVRERIDEVLELKSGIRFDCFSRGGYVERNGVSYFVGSVIPLTAKQKLIVRLLETEPETVFDVDTVGGCCWNLGGGCKVRPGTVRTAICEINSVSRTLAGFDLIGARRKEGYYFKG